MREITREYFIERVGREPENDDLERCNCHCGNVVGHLMCGWCEVHEKPRFICMCGPHTNVLTKPGWFKPVYTSSRYARESFVVDASDYPAVIPNFGLLPLVFNNVITVLFEDGAPDELKEYILKEIDWALPMTMEESTFARAVGNIEYLLSSLAAQGRLKRGLKGKWVFDLGDGR